MSIAAPTPSASGSGRRISPGTPRWTGLAAVVLSGLLLATSVIFFRAAGRRSLPPPIPAASAPVSVPAPTIAPAAGTRPLSALADAEPGGADAGAWSDEGGDRGGTEGVNAGGADGGSLFLLDGRRIDGVVERLDEGYRVRRGRVAMFVADDRVRAYVPGTTAAKELAEQLRLLPDGDADARLALAQWCRDNSLPDEARKLLREAARLRPEDSKLNQRAGFVRVGQEWLEFAEAQRRKGLRFFENRWLKSEEIERLRAFQEEREMRNAATRAAMDLLNASAERAPEDPWETAETLARMGPDVFPALERALERPAARSLAAMAWSRFRGEYSLKRLMDLLRFSRPSARPALLAALARRGDREEALQGFLDQAVNLRTAAGRRRAAEALAALADARVIDALVPLTEFCPVPAPKDNSENDGEAKSKATLRRDADYTVTSNALAYSEEDSQGQRKPWQREDRGRRRAEQPYFPAHEALQALLRDTLPVNADAIAHYWASRRQHFAFAPPPMEDWGVGPSAPAYSDQPPGRADALMAENAASGAGRNQTLSAGAADAASALTVRPRTVAEDRAAAEAAGEGEGEDLASWEFDPITRTVLRSADVSAPAAVGVGGRNDPLAGRHVTADWLMAEAQAQQEGKRPGFLSEPKAGGPSSGEPSSPPAPRSKSGSRVITKTPATGEAPTSTRREPNAAAARRLAPPALAAPPASASGAAAEAASIPESRGGAGAEENGGVSFSWLDPAPIRGGRPPSTAAPAPREDAADFDWLK